MIDIDNYKEVKYIYDNYTVCHLGVSNIWAGVCISVKLNT